MYVCVCVCCKYMTVPCIHVKALMCECVNSSSRPDEHFLNPLLLCRAVCNLGLPVHLMLRHHKGAQACSLLQEGERVNVNTNVCESTSVCALTRHWVLHA